MIRISAFLLLCLLLSGCGQKGALYLQSEEDPNLASLSSEDNEEKGK